ncbi:MAG: hypothetical protein AB7P42_09255 [Gammaproteobacteria bacterium]
MDLIIARFRERADAERAVQALNARGFSLGRESTAAGAAPDFHVSPDPAESSGAERTGSHAAGGAVAGSVAGGVVGVVAATAVAPLIGPGAIVAGIGVGAYAGALIGALSGAEQNAAPDEPSLAQRDEIIKVEVNGAAGRALALEVLSAHGAVDVREERG